MAPTSQIKINAAAKIIVSIFIVIMCYRFIGNSDLLPNSINPAVFFAWISWYDNH